MCNIDENANLVLSFGILIRDTCCFSQNIQNYLLSLVDICDVFDMFVVEVLQYAIR
jgi:hypothetical protein